MHVPWRVRVRAARPRLAPVGARAERREARGRTCRCGRRACTGTRRPTPRRPAATRKSSCWPGAGSAGAGTRCPRPTRPAARPTGCCSTGSAACARVARRARRPSFGRQDWPIEAARDPCPVQGVRSGRQLGRAGLQGASGQETGAAGAREAGPAGGPAGRQLAGQVVVVEREDGERGQRAVAAAPAARQRAAQRVVPRGQQAQLRQRARLAPRGRQPACARRRAAFRAVRGVYNLPRPEARIGASQRQAGRGSARRAPAPAGARSRSRPPRPR